MKKIIPVFASLMLVMAILVSGGYVKERGFFYTFEDVYDKYSSVAIKGANSLVDFELGTRTEFEPDEKVSFVRIWLVIGGDGHYVDLLATLDFDNPDFSIYNVHRDLISGNYQISDTNYPGDLKIVKTFGYFKIYDDDKKWPRRYVWMYLRPFFYDSDPEYLTLTYLDYVTNYRGKAIHLG